MERDDELFLVVSPEANHVRAVRLVIGDAGNRAGLTVDEIDDLCLAVTELTHAVIDATRQRVAFRVRVSDSKVVVRATARRMRADDAPRLHSIPSRIVQALVDEHVLSHSSSELWFILSKTTRGPVRA